jgi:hypothetical protein
MESLRRGFTDLPDERLLKRGNKILQELFCSSTSSIRQICRQESDAKGFYRFLNNERIKEDQIISNLSSNCQRSCRGRYVICIEDSTEINLISHQKRIKKDGYIGVVNNSEQTGLGFYMHPSLVLDAHTGVPYGYATVKLWNRGLEIHSKGDRGYKQQPIEQKESYKWIETSQKTQEVLQDIVAGMVIVEDREGDIYEQFARIPNKKTDLLVRSRGDRKLSDGTNQKTCLLDQAVQGTYQVLIDGKAGRPRRNASIEVRYRPITICRGANHSKNAPSTIDLYLIEARETNHRGKDAIWWHLLTTIPVENLQTALQCIEWYSWRWTIEEVFKILKKEGYNIEASELESASAIRKLSLLILETVIKLFLMRLAYAQPEEEIEADTCFNEEELIFLTAQIPHLEGKTEKQKNPYQNSKDLKRYAWVLARLGGWKGYESKRHPGITTLWIGLKRFKDMHIGWLIHRNVSTR